jgi:hypothetical protein
LLTQVAQEYQLAQRADPPLGHIILILSQPVFALNFNTACLAEKQQIPISVIGLT